jgi:ketosteroid isomerase-like protein
MQEYGTAYRHKDSRALAALFSPAISGFGSGADEIIHDHAGFLRQIRRDMSQASAISFEFSDTKIFGDGRVAWVTTGSTITFSPDGNRKQVMRGRSTMVMRNTGSRWLIEQVHFSMPFCDQSPGQSFPGA